MKWEDIYSGKAYELLEREEKAAQSMEQRAIRRKKTQRLNYQKSSRNNIRKPSSNTRHAVHKRTCATTTNILPAQGYFAVFAVLSIGLMLFFILGIAPFAKATEPTHTSLEVSDRAYSGDSAPAPEFGTSDNSANNNIVQEDGINIPNANEEESAVTETAFDESASQDLTVTDIALKAQEEKTGIDVAPNETESKPMATASGNDWSNITYRDFEGLSTEEKVELIGAMAKDDAADTHILASVTAAQAILESGWMSSSLTVNYENYFGIKASSGGYNWEGSTWNPDEVAVMPTQEEYEIGVITDIEAGFRVYHGTWDSIRDHSAYLLNSGLYPGITDATTPEEVVNIIADGGYATGNSYANSLLALIYTYDLTRFDV